MSTITSVYSGRQIQQNWVTIFTASIGDGFVSSCVTGDGFGRTEREAVERLAARVLKVEPRQLELEHEGGNVWRATIAATAAQRRIDTHWGALGLLIATAAVIGVISAVASGGAK